MPKCRNCEKILIEDATFCPSCSLENPLDGHQAAKKKDDGKPHQIQHGSGGRRSKPNLRTVNSLWEVTSVTLWAGGADADAKCFSSRKRKLTAKHHQQLITPGQKT